MKNISENIFFIEGRKKFPSILKTTSSHLMMKKSVQYMIIATYNIKIQAGILCHMNYTTLDKHIRKRFNIVEIFLEVIE